MSETAYGATTRAGNAGDTRSGMRYLAIGLGVSVAAAVLVAEVAAIVGLWIAYRTVL
jgi:hypothetical protein